MFFLFFQNWAPTCFLVHALKAPLMILAPCTRYGAGCLLALWRALKNRHGNRNEQRQENISSCKNHVMLLLFKNNRGRCGSKQSPVKPHGECRAETEAPLTLFGNS